MKPIKDLVVEVPKGYTVETPDKAIRADILDAMYDYVASIMDLSVKLRHGEITVVGASAILDADCNAMNHLLDELDDI